MKPSDLSGALLSCLNVVWVVAFVTTLTSKKLIVVSRSLQEVHREHSVEFGDVDECGLHLLLLILS